MYRVNASWNFLIFICKIDCGKNHQDFSQNSSYILYGYSYKKSVILEHTLEKMHNNISKNECHDK